MKTHTKNIPRHVPRKQWLVRKTSSSLSSLKPVAPNGRVTSHIFKVREVVPFLECLPSPQKKCLRSALHKAVLWPWTFQPSGAETGEEGSRLQGCAGCGGPECFCMAPLKSTYFHCVLGFLLHSNEMSWSNATWGGRGDSITGISGNLHWNCSFVTEGGQDRKSRNLETKPEAAAA